MSNLSNELFFNVHRGLLPKTLLKAAGGVKPDEEVGKTRLGIHWTASPTVAKTFAGENGFWGPGTVFHGTAPISAVETDTSKLNERQVDLEGKLHEKEITLKKNAPVTLTGKDTIKERKGKMDPKYPGESIPLYRVRKRTYTPPREMKA